MPISKRTVPRAINRKMMTPVASIKMTTAMDIAPHSLDELVAVSGLSKPTVTKFVKELTDAKMVRVGAWLRDRRGYPTIRQYAMGNAPDAACPVLYRNAAERMRIKRAAKKAGAQ